MRKRWYLCIAAFLISVIAILLSLLAEPHAYEAQLSDGSIARLVKVGVGKYSYDSFPPLKAYVADLLPFQHRHLLGERLQTTVTCPPSEISLLFNLRTKDNKSKQDIEQILSRIEFIESTGHVFNVSIHGYGSTSGLMHIDEGPFPRRDPVLHMRLYERSTDRLLYDLKLPNPGYQPTFTEWTPEPLPVTQTQEPLTVTLFRGPADIPGKFPREEDLEIVSTDPSWTSTRPQIQFWLTDVTGCRAYGFDGLSPFEPAWKLHARIRRNNNAPFKDDEIWRTEWITMPEPLKAQRLLKKGTAGGLEFSIAYVASAGQLIDDGQDLTVTATNLPPNGGTSSGQWYKNGKAINRIDSPLAHFHLDFSSPDENTDLNITVKDQNGRNLSLNRGTSTRIQQGISTRLVQFQPTPDTKELQMEVIVNRGRTFEFIVAPPKPKLQRNKSSDASSPTTTK